MCVNITAFFKLSCVMYKISMHLKAGASGFLENRTMTAILLDKTQHLIPVLGEGLHVVCVHTRTASVSDPIYIGTIQKTCVYSTLQKLQTTLFTAAATATHCVVYTVGPAYTKEVSTIIAHAERAASTSAVWALLSQLKHTFGLRMLLTEHHGCNSAYAAVIDVCARKTRREQASVCPGGFCTLDCEI